MMKIAWIGTGVMGSEMARHLQAHGHMLQVFNRTLAKAEPLAQYGMIVCHSIAECVKDCDVVFTMVGDPSDVEAIYFGEGGIFQSAKANAYLIDMTTSSPTLAKKLSQNTNFHVLDAPVSGGDIGAKNGTLSVMCGGKKEDFEAMKTVFACFADTMTYQGEAGSGQHCKACNQIAIAGAIASVAEALAYAKKMELDPLCVWEAISKGAAGSFQMTNNGKKMLEEDDWPGFYIKHFIKDMKIAMQELQQQNLYFPILNQVEQLYETLSQKGYDEKGTQAIIDYYK